MLHEWGGHQSVNCCDVPLSLWCYTGGTLNPGGCPLTLAVLAERLWGGSTLSLCLRVGLTLLCLGP